MPSLKLSPADRERLGAPEEMPMDLASLTNREAIQLRTFGFPTPRVFRKALQMREVPALDEDGNPEKDDDGNPVVDRVMNYEAWTALVWLMLRRVGVNVDVREFEFDLNALEYIPDPEPEEVVEVDEPGKAPEPEDSTT